MDRRVGARRGNVLLAIVGIVVLGAIGVSAALGTPSGLAQGPPGYGYGYGYGYENPTPTPTTTGTPTPTPTATPKPDKPPKPPKPPKCKPPKPRAGQTPASVRTKGLRMKGECEATVRATVRVLVTGKTADKLGIKRKARRPVVVGSRRRVLPAGVARDVTVKLSRKAARRVGRARKVTFSVVQDARDVEGTATRVRRTVTVRRR